MLVERKDGSEKDCNATSFRQNLSKKQNVILLQLPQNKYIFLFAQIHLVPWTNTSCTLDKYIMYFGQIHLVPWTNVFCKSSLATLLLPQTNTCFFLKPWIGKIHFAIWRNNVARACELHSWQSCARQIVHKNLSLHRLLIQIEIKEKCKSMKKIKSERKYSYNAPAVSDKLCTKFSQCGSFETNTNTNNYWYKYKYNCWNVQQRMYLSLTLSQKHLQLKYGMEP